MATIFWLFIYDAHWCHLANATEPSMCGSDAALCQITLTNCYSSCCFIQFIIYHSYQNYCFSVIVDALL